MDYMFMYSGNSVLVDKCGTFEIEGNLSFIPAGISITTSLIGTNMVDFLNFNVLEFRSEYNFEDFDWSYMKIAEHIPVFIRQFFFELYDAIKVHYNEDGINHILKLQEYYKKLLARCFDLEQIDENKTPAIIRYKNHFNVPLNLDIEKGFSDNWFVFTSLEQALTIEFLKCIETNRNIFICKLCGSYSVAATSKRGNFCKRLNRVVIREGLKSPDCFIIKECQTAMKDKRAKDKAYNHPISRICYRQTGNIEAALSHDRLLLTDTKLALLKQIRAKVTQYIEKYDALTDPSQKEQLAEEYERLFKGLYMNTYPKHLSALLD